MLIISDSFWNEIKNLILDQKSHRGRPWHDPKMTLSGIFYIMKTGAQWHCLPDYYGKPTTVHGRFIVWIKSGIFEKILKRSIRCATKRLGSPKSFFIDTSSVKAPFANFSGKNPTDRAKRGIKKGIVIDMNRIILSIMVHAANKHDARLVLPHAKALKRYLKNPKVLAADAAFDAKALRRALAQQNLALHSSTNTRRNKSMRRIHSNGRWRIEQIFGIQQWYRGIKTCWNKMHGSFLALCQLVAAIHNFKLAGIFG